ncbi:hypothetical protein D477_005591 [Arthrobacter crystallopoietes BAB-32]|uniref:PIN domain-containing protein n=1 Tax=Arthrobacter crystallopoietes BAB-32 TaxID=1246476 RepID=N1VAA1_9MICC|nr:PIN domain-containing protein [Arthrobacter crystallopoietes]EMY35213.1 hypothetical protein D477_005591 [Arthrobacter crystallopoietes BAB-32]
MQPGATRIFLDANVLFSRTLRDWFSLISLNAGIEGISLHWSEDVMSEYQYHIRRKHPGWSEQQIGGWRRRLTESFPDAMIIGYEIDPGLLESNDKFDAHVLAAAAHGSVDYLVTANYSDFEPFSERFEFEIFSPDEMLCLINERRPDAVRAATKRQLSYWAGRPSSKSLTHALVDAGAPAFAHHVKTLLAEFALSGNY